MSCSHCESQHNFCSSTGIDVPTDSLVKNTKFCEINLRFVYGLRSIGKGMTADQILLNLLQALTKFNSYTKIIGEAVHIVSQPSVQAAVEEAVRVKSLELFQ